MATLATTTEGYHMVLLSKSERDYLWMELDQKIQAPTMLHLRNKNHTYQIVSEKETGYEKYEVTIKANGVTKKLKTTLYNQQEKICKAVSDIYALSN